MFDRRLASPIVKIKTDLERRVCGAVELPLGVEVATADINLREGYESRYVPSDGRGDDQFEFRILLSLPRVEETARRFFETLLPEGVFATFEEFSADAYRDLDGYACEEPISRTRLLQAWESYGRFFCEDARSGFG